MRKARRRRRGDPSRPWRLPLFGGDDGCLDDSIGRARLYDSCSHARPPDPIQGRRRVDGRASVIGSHTTVPVPAPSSTVDRPASPSRRESPAAHPQRPPAPPKHRRRVDGVGGGPATASGRVTTAARRRGPAAPRETGIASERTQNPKRNDPPPSFQETTSSDPLTPPRRRETPSYDGPPRLRCGEPCEPLPVVTTIIN